MRYKIVSWAIYIVLCFIWGSSFKLMKVGMTMLSPYQVASIRMMSAGLVMLPFIFRAVKNIPRNRMGYVVLSGLLGAFIPAFLFCLAETKIDSSLAGILNALTPLFAILVGVAFYKLKVSRQKYLGVIIGFVGLCLLFLSRGNISLNYLSYASLVLIATFLYGINVNIISTYMGNIGSINTAALAFTFLIIPSSIVLGITGFFSYPLTQHDYFIATAGSAVLGIFGTAVASILFYVLVKRSSGLFASTVTYAIPFVAIFWGMLSGETITFLQVICLAIILAGVYLASKPEVKNELKNIE